MAEATETQAAEAQTYGIVLVKGATYMYKGVRFRRGQPAEVDLASRNHLVASGHFRDTNYEPPEPQPIPVRRRPGGVRVHRRSQQEPGMVSAEGGATACGRDDDVEEPTDDGPDVEEPVVEV